MIKRCSQAGVDKANHVFLFYEGLLEKTRRHLDASAGGWFMRKDTKDA